MWWWWMGACLSEDIPACGHDLSKSLITSGFLRFLWVKHPAGFQLNCEPSM